MKILRNIDRKDYNDNSPIIKREAVRAIIFKDGKLVVIKSKKIGEYKLPGGGIDFGESHHEALEREVLEETGLKIIPSSIKEYGTLMEKKKDIFGEGIFHQISYYYLCEVENKKYNPKLTQSEINFGYETECVEVVEAINNNEQLLKRIVDTTWIERETYVFKLIESNLIKK